MTDEESEEANAAAKAEKIELAKFTALMETDDFTMVILRVHLFVEGHLERIIRAAMPRGEVLVRESGFVSFFQKLTIVDALGILPQELKGAIRGLNTVRNRCAHDLAKNLTEADYVLIASPLGVLGRARRTADFEELKALKNALATLCGQLSRITVAAEHEDEQEDE